MFCSTSLYYEPFKELKNNVLIADAAYQGACGEKLTWSLDDEGTLTISGTGSMTNYSSDNSSSIPWRSYWKSIQRIEIESGVTSIGDWAFWDLTNVTSISIPDTVTSIGNSSFYTCKGLKSVAIPDSVTDIGEAVFGYCQGLNTISISSSITTIPNSAFYACTNLKSITLPDSITTLGDYSFSCCYKLQSIIIPENVNSIGKEAFQNCQSLASVTILNPNCTIYDGNKTFSTSYPDISFAGLIIGYVNSTAQDYASKYWRTFVALEQDGSVPDVIGSGNSENLTWTLDNEGTLLVSGTGEMSSLNLPNYKNYIRRLVVESGITRVGLGSCVNLTSVSIPSSVTSISSFSGCKSLTSIEVPDSQTTIEDYAFSGCTSLTSIELPDSITAVKDYAFNECASLESITIPENVMTIGKYAFRKCSSLTSITIPDSVTSIGDYAFVNCSKLNNITILDPGCDISATSIYSYDNNYNGTICGYEDSTAQVYARSYHIPFISLGEGCYHKYGINNWTWSTDDHICTVELKCSNCQKTKTLKPSVKISDDSTFADCTNEERITYIAEITLNDNIYSDSIVEVVPAKGHSYYVDQWAWAWDSLECCAAVKCNDCDESLNVITPIRIEEEKEANCTENGFRKYSAEISIGEGVHCASITNVIDATGHNYQAESWNWNNDYSQCDVTLKCQNCDSTITQSATITKSTSESIAPTCTSSGQNVYIASVMFDGTEYRNTFTEDIPAIGHSYSIEKWNWSEDCSSCSVDLKCAKCGDVKSEVAQVDLTESIDPNCTESGYEVYTATISFEGEVYSESKTKTTESSTGHNYEAVWTWSDDLDQCNVVLTCSECGTIVEREATVELIESIESSCTDDGHNTYRATITVDGVEYSDTKTKALPATGHSYNIEWNWSDDRKQCNAVLTCERCGTIVNKEATVELIESTETSCTQDGKNIYSATVLVDGNEYSDVNHIYFPTTGHNYEPVWSWADDYYGCNLELHCNKCDEYIGIDRLVVNTSSEIIKEASYDENGIERVTAECSYDGITYSSTKDYELPALPKTDISSAKVILSATSFDYDGTEKNVNITSVTLNGETLENGVDYIITGNTETESGDYTLTLSGIGAYKGIVNRSWRIVRKYNVSYTVNSLTKNYIFTEKSFCIVNANEEEGVTFSYWKLSDSDTILSYNKSYIFRVISDISLEAVYNINGEAIVKVPVIAITSVNALNDRIYFEITRDVPDDFTVIQNGVIYSKSAMFDDYDSDALDDALKFINDDGETMNEVIATASSVNTNKGYYSYYVDMSEDYDQQVYLRGYIVAEDSEGNSEIYYSGITNCCYNQLVNG